MKKSFFRSYEFLLVVMLVVFILIIGLINPAFFSIGTLFDAIRIQTIWLIMAFGLLPVVILGGVDISYVAIAAVATYPVHMYLLTTTYTGGIWLYYVMATAIGILIGIFIALLLYYFKLSIFDLSLGMNTMLYGLNTFFVGSLTNFDMDTGLAYWNQKFIIEVESVVGSSGLHVSFLVIILLGVLMHLLLTYTTLGRGIYAVGSAKSVAIRTGFNLRRIYLVVFPLMGAFSAIAGVIFGGLQTYFAPIAFLGKNMQVLAAVVLGGASTRGGKGTVFGTFLGTLLIGIINQSLVYLGVDTQWYDAVIGTIFIIYATFQSLTSARNE